MPRPATSSLERGSLFLYLWKKGATLLTLYCPDYDYVSIHAPLKGATSFYLSLNILRICFNSRTPKGCDGFVGR